MADLYLNQAEADDLLTFLAIDYLKLLGRSNIFNFFKDFFLFIFNIAFNYKK